MKTLRFKRLLTVRFEQTEAQFLSPLYENISPFCTHPLGLWNIWELKKLNSLLQNFHLSQVVNGLRSWGFPFRHFNPTSRYTLSCTWAFATLSFNAGETRNGRKETCQWLSAEITVELYKCQLTSILFKLLSAADHEEFIVISSFKETASMKSWCPYCWCSYWVITFSMIILIKDPGWKFDGFPDLTIRVRIWFWSDLSGHDLILIRPFGSGSDSWSDRSSHDLILVQNVWSEYLDPMSITRFWSKIGPFLTVEGEMESGAK